MIFVITLKMTEEFGNVNFEAEIVEAEEETDGAQNLEVDYKRKCAFDC